MQYDIDFLSALDEQKIHKILIRVTLLDFVTEQSLFAIEGTLGASGSINVNGSSAIRRTISFTMFANNTYSDITNLDNMISLNKKIKVEIGMENYIMAYKQLYGDTVWFPQGVYIISSLGISRTNNGLSINIQGKDKMAQLDGTIGGTLPASVTFHERYDQLDTGEILVNSPTIYQIISEAVQHYGGENASNIFINDVDLTAKILIKHMGSTPMQLDITSGAFVFSNVEREGWLSYSKGQDIGYFTTPFTYPGELVLAAGETVVSLLDKIISVLGNFEYFYDVHGKFYFQEKKNYLNKKYSPLSMKDNKIIIKYFSENISAYTLHTDTTVISYNNNPKIDNLKNDFVIWGQKTTAFGFEKPICYHLAIDEKPVLDLSLQYMWKDENGYMLSDIECNEYTNSNNKIGPGLKNPDWREELYRQALLKRETGSSNSVYDEELIAFWRSIYDPLNEDWALDTSHKYASYTHWNPSVYLNPGELDYWLDFIDTDATLGKYSVNQIGRRTKAVNDSKITSLFNPMIPDIIFLNEKLYQDSRQEEVTGISFEDLKDIYDQQNQTYSMVKDSQLSNFSTSTTGASAYEVIQNLLYQHLVYNASISITCTPKYFLEPNTLINVQDSKSGINGDFNITQFTIPLSYNGTMTITATEVLNKI